MFISNLLISSDLLSSSVQVELMLNLVRLMVVLEAHVKFSSVMQMVMPLVLTVHVRSR